MSIEQTSRPALYLSIPHPCSYLPEDRVYTETARFCCGFIKRVHGGKSVRKHVDHGDAEQIAACAKLKKTRFDMSAREEAQIPLWIRTVHAAIRMPIGLISPEQVEMALVE